MAHNYECESCGAVYPTEIVSSWGKTRESNGHGPTPRCVQLVPDFNAPPARDSNGRILKEPAQQNCQGSLRRVSHDVTPTIADLTDIPEGRTL